jgi:hypothetical protein
MPLAHTRSARARSTRLVASVLSTVIIASGLTVIGADTASAASGSVQGTVFRDFNANGTLDSGNRAVAGVANDQGVAGVTVTAYSAAGTAAGTATTSASGEYTISVDTGSAGSELRVEFTGLPAEYEAGAVAAAGSDNGTTEQFVEVGATGVDLAVNAPEDFSTDDAPVATVIQYAGKPSGSAGSQPAVVAQPYSANFPVSHGGNSDDPTPFPERVTLATFAEVGAVWGSAFQTSTNDMLVSATYKRQSGLGSLGLGGIYRITDAVDGGAPSASGTAAPWLDVTTIGIDVGTALSNDARGLGDARTPAYDADAFAKVGKVGIGGIALSADGGTLYLVNLFDKKLYRIALPADGSLPTAADVSSFDLDLTAGERPWAVQLYRDGVYVGYVDSGETAGDTANPGRSAAQAGLNAHVLRADAGALGSWTEVLTADLAYAKGDVYNNTLADAAHNGQSHQWNTWADTWSWTVNGGGSVAQQSGGWHIYPSPVLSSLYFDEDGYLTLGLADRTSMQGGNRNWAADPAKGTASFETGASGDILLASPDGDGSFTLERNGVASSRTTTAGSTNEGPGTREFYNDALNQGTGSTHKEVTLGALAGLRGSGSVVATEYDPLSGIRLAGLGWLSIDTGTGLAGYEQTEDGGGSAGVSGTFQKGGGLGSIQLLTALAPIEIGNRVWFDADQDGIQDADEPALPGVTVNLLDSSGTVVATRTTDSEGNYYFSSDASSDFYDADLTTDTSYTVQFVTPATGNAPLDADQFGTVPWSAISLTSSETKSTSSSGSNPDPVTGEYDYTTGGPGENDHTIDAGYVANASFTIAKSISADGDTPAAGATFVMNPSATDFRGAVLDLGASETVTLAAGQTSGAIVVPIGTRVAVTEQGASEFRNVTIAPSGPQLIAIGSTPFAFTVTNELFEPGRFSIRKNVTGSAASSVAASQSFTVNYTYRGLTTPGTLTMKNDGTVVTSSPIPYGTTVTLSEAAPTGAPADVQWNTPTWAGSGVTDNGDGTASITIGDATTTAITLTNPTTRLFGGFTVTKVVSGSAANSVPGSFEFTVEYSTDGTTWTPLTVSKNDPSETVGNLPAGTVVQIREVAPGAAAPDVDFGTPVFSGTGVTTTGGVSSFTVGAGTTLAVTLTNPTDRLFGQFSITKDVTGGAESTLVAGHEFTVGYTATDGTSGTFDLENGQLYTSAPFPIGTEVTITEVTPTGGLPDGSSWGTPTLKVGGTTLANGASIRIDAQGVIAIVLTNPTIVTPDVHIEKGDGTGTTIDHDADTMPEGETYTVGETRTIVFRVKNTGTDELREVTLTDGTVSGATVQGLTWTLPDGTTLPATLVGDSWTAPWAETFAPGTTTWKPGEVVTGTATLQLTAAAAPHVDSAHVDATGVYSGTPVSDEDDYNAFTGDIQVIKYDGEKADPAVTDATGNWIIPTKPLTSPAQDANGADTAVEYPVSKTQRVRWVVTNTGTTSLTDITLVDATTAGPSIGADWTADLSPFGGPASYSFATSGAWPGVLPPGASFFAEGTLSLPESANHSDTVTVTGTIVVPEVDGTGRPTGDPATDAAGTPVIARDDAGNPMTVTDNDPFTARTGTGPRVDIEKGDGSGTSIVHDADTAAEAEVYTPGETRTVVFTVTNTGDEPLREVQLTDTSIAGGEITSLTWTLPNGQKLPAEKTAVGWSAQWAETFGTGAATWKPKEVITGTAELTVSLADAAHEDRATVRAVGAASGIAVTDSDDYHAVTAALQVIKYAASDGDPVVQNAAGEWVIPDADSASASVTGKAGSEVKIRWVVTNIGTSAVTNLMVEDVTLAGAEVGDDWTADLSPIGGPKEYSFVDDGPWAGTLEPGESFFSEGTVTLTRETHEDTVEATADVLAPDGTVVAVAAVSSADELEILATPTGPLASTGMNVVAAVWVTLTLLLLGLALIVLVYVPRRRRRI